MPDPTPAPQSAAWRDAVTTLLGDIDNARIDQLAMFRDLILASSQQFNLTALRDSEAIDYRLILESLRLWKLIQQRCQPLETANSLIDIGSGAGIPGVPISIMQPDWRVVMIEATGKKARFIQQACGTLGLRDARVEHGRAEDLGRMPAYREMSDLVVARAVGSLPTLLELSMPLLRKGGRAFFPKGPMTETELRDGDVAANELGARISERAALPDIDGCPVTQMVIADKIAPIPERYPRRAGIPAKEPLGG